MNLSVKDASRLLAVSEKTIYRWIKQDLVPAYKVSGSYRFNRAELLEWATSRRMGVAADAFEEPESGALPLPTLHDALEGGGVIYRLEGKTREEVLAGIVAHLRLPDEVDRDQLLQVLIAREKIASTAIGGGIAIPHPRNPLLPHIFRPTVTLCFLEKPVEYFSLDGEPVQILFTLIAPSLRTHLHLLSKLAFVLHERNFRKRLQEQASREKIFTALKRAEERINNLQPEPTAAATS